MILTNIMETERRDIQIVESELVSINHSLIVIVFSLLILLFTLDLGKFYFLSLTPLILLDFLKSIENCNRKSL